MAKKETKERVTIADWFLNSAAFNRALEKMKGKLHDHVGIVMAVTNLAIHQELIRIRTVLEGRPVETAKKLVVQEPEEDREQRIGDEVKAANADAEEELFVEETGEDDAESEQPEEEKPKKGGSKKTLKGRRKA